MTVRIAQDNTQEVLSGLRNAIDKALEESGLYVENAAKQLCPVDTGRLRNSITHQKSGDKTEQVGTNVEYGKFVELGTSRMGAKPYLKPAAQNSESAIEGIFKSNFS